MSRNVYKSSWVVVENDDKCLIDSNSRLVSRIEEREADRRKKAALAAGEEVDMDGFMGGLIGERIDAQDYEEDAEGGSVLKAAEEVPAGPTPEELREQAEAELEAARQEAEQIRRMANADAAKEKQAAAEEGRRAGYDEGYRMAQAEAGKMRRELEEERSRMEAEYGQLVAELEPQFIDTITAVYNHVFHVELENERNILVHLIETTLRKIESSRTFIVHVSRDDYPYVNMQKKMLTESAVGGRGIVEVVEDITLHKNECMIETDGGIFDCGVGTQLEELTKRLRLLSFEKDETDFQGSI
ncbi:MAG: FliH/SctL family protein [Blautia sp.]|nr:FliH/SctL family protein [Blautia sp.]MCM1201165.1 FliH/SctL family protein [Bacteroides fragilis]